MGLCNTCSDFIFDPTMESPAAYVKLKRQEALEEMLYAEPDENQLDDEEDEEYFNSLSKAEQRVYLDKKVKQRLAKMSAGDQQAMFKRFNVSVSSNPNTRRAQLWILVDAIIQRVSCAARVWR